MKLNVIEIGDKKLYTNFLLMKDMENIYLKKNEIDHARNEGDMERAMSLYHNYLSLLYSDIDKEYREYVFIYNIISSEGRSNYKLQYQCEYCEKVTTAILSIGMNHKLPSFEYENIKINFDYTNNVEGDIHHVLDNINSIEINDYNIKWNLLSEETKEIIISYIDPDDYPDIFNSIQMCRASVKGHNQRCCDKGLLIKDEEKFYGGFNIFDVLVNSKNLTMLYQLNHQLLSRGISLTDQMLMKPFERNIYINMIIKKEKEEAEEYESRLSKR